jgi:nucleoside-diphosphate-sugar epimerase
MNSKPKIIVTGSGSLVAHSLIPQLLESSFTLLLPGRRRCYADVANITCLQVDLDNKAERLAAVKLLATETKPFVFIHLAPIWLLPNFLQELLAAGVLLSRLMAFSSTSRLVKLNSEVVEERNLAVRLAEGENKLITFCADKIPWTIFRPTLIYDGRRDKNIAFIRSFIRRFGFFPVAGPATGLRQPVHADDLAAAVMAVLDNRQTYNTIYNLGGGETLTYRKMVSVIFQSLGKRERIISLPPVLFLSLVRLVRLFRPRLGVSPAMVQRMNDDLSFDFQPAVRDFAYQPRRFKC